eukprot:COSAG01_NODE_580_length_15231_cov_6.793220_4_plen_98_part_00
MIGRVVAVVVGANLDPVIATAIAVILTPYIVVTVDENCMIGVSVAVGKVYDPCTGRSCTATRDSGAFAFPAGDSIYCTRDTEAAAKLCAQCEKLFSQ